MARRRQARRQRARGSRQQHEGRGRRQRAKASVDIDSLTDQVLGEVMVRMGLEGLVDAGLVREIVRDIVSSIADSRSTKPTAESIVKRIASNSEAFLKAVAAALLEEPDKLSREQLEFIVSNAPDLAGRAAPALYHRALELGAEGVVGALRSLWLRYGRPTPVRCPRCGFNAVTPQLACMVCGAELDEEEVKEAMGFREMLRSFALRADARLVEEAARAGYVLVDDDIHPPSVRPLLSFYLELRLTRKEREILEAALRSRG